MSQPKQLLVLKNVMDHKIDIHITTLQLKKTGRRVAINTSHIISIKLEYTKYDKENLSYYVITLINGEQIYVNKMNALQMGLFEAAYTINEDYEVINTLMYTL